MGGLLEVRCDLHVHSCLSPCADDDMTVNNIANMSMICGLDIVALTDHNSLKNCPAFFTACGRAGVVPVAGAELCTREEVHVLCLFAELDAGMAFDAYLEDKIPGFMNNPMLFGRQLALDADDRILYEEPRLLISACDISVDELPSLTRRYGGVAVPAHIDRSSNSLISNLGFIPAEYEFTCYELRFRESLPRLARGSPALASARIICDSDAHSLTDIGNNEERGGGRLPLREKTAAALIEALSTRI